MDANGIRELFSEFGPVDVRRMFGGMGVFADGLMIALVARGEIYLKADTQTIASFEHEGQQPFSYATKSSEHVLTSYWRMPERLYDDTDELARWARDSHAVALRANAAKSRPKAKKKIPKARTRQPLTPPAARQP